MLSFEENVVKALGVCFFAAPCRLDADGHGHVKVCLKVLS